MQIDDLTKGGEVELEVKVNNKTMNFQSKIVLVRDNSVLINSIQVNNQTVGFSEKCRINFLYKSDGKLFIWENVVIKLVRYDGLIFHKIDLLGEGKSYNRRDSFRLFIGEEMTLSYNTATGPTAIDVLIKDISETGVGFITKEALDIERTFRLRIKEDNILLNLSGTIVRSEYLDNLHSNLYGCKFSEKNQLLGKYIAKKQSELLKKNSLYSSPLTRGLLIR